MYQCSYLSRYDTNTLNKNGRAACFTCSNDFLYLHRVNPLSQVHINGVERPLYFATVGLKKTTAGSWKNGTIDLLCHSWLTANQIQTNAAWVAPCAWCCTSTLPVHYHQLGKGYPSSSLWRTSFSRASCDFSIMHYSHLSAQVFILTIGSRMQSIKMHFVKVSCKIFSFGSAVSVKRLPSNPLSTVHLWFPVWVASGSH